MEGGKEINPTKGRGEVSMKQEKSVWDNLANTYFEFKSIDDRDAFLTWSKSLTVKNRKELLVWKKELLKRCEFLKSNIGISDEETEEMVLNIENSIKGFYKEIRKLL